MKKWFKGWTSTRHWNRGPIKAISTRNIDGFSKAEEDTRLALKKYESVFSLIHRGLNEEKLQSFSRYKKVGPRRKNGLILMQIF